MKLKNDILFRAVKKKNREWVENGVISSAAFRDDNGTSVEKQSKREKNEVILSMKEYLDCTIVLSITIKNCIQKRIFIKHEPKESYHHHCLYRNYLIKPLTMDQADYLAEKANVIHSDISLLYSI